VPVDRAILVILGNTLRKVFERLFRTEAGDMIRTTTRARTRGSGRWVTHELGTELDSLRTEIQPNCSFDEQNAKRVRAPV
jgi:hypothetical protein